MNTKYFVTIIVTLLLSFPVCSQNWSVTNSDNSGRYDDIYFHDENLGWSVGGSSIYKTEDGGDSWIEVYAKRNLYFRSIEFLNEKIGIAGTLSSVILRTIDGGATWIEIQDLLPKTVPGICGLSHVGDNVYGVGIFSYPAFFIKSLDQGITWKFIDLSSFADGLVECHFINSDIGFIGGINESSGGVILKTKDGGNTWKEVLNTKNGMEYIWKLDFVTEEIGYGAVESLSFSSEVAHIVKTTDGGETWTVILVDSQYLDLQGIGFINEDKGWVGPRTQPMYETNDGGLTWNINSDLFQNINRFFRINSELLYASGSHIYKYSGSSVSTYNLPVYLDHHSIILRSANPLNDQVRFIVEIESMTNARLDLINHTGDHIHNIYAGPIKVGTHEFELNNEIINRITNGVYYIVLRTNEGFLSTPIVK